MAWDRGAGDCFHILLRRRLALNIFPFPVTTAKLIGEFYNNRRARRMDVCASPILSCSLYCANTIGAAIRVPLIGEAQRIIKNPRNQLIGAANAHHFT